jgi:hypothetical protein
MELRVQAGGTAIISGERERVASAVLGNTIYTCMRRPSCCSSPAPPPLAAQRKTLGRNWGRL